MTVEGGIGQPMKRKEDARFIRGQGNYIDDVELPGMLYLDIVRSPYAHARITSLDTTEVLKVPGAPAAITNAVADALAHLGVTHIDIPITPWKVWKVLHEKGTS